MLVAELLLFLAPFSIVSFVPKLFFGAVLTFIAADLMLDWLVLAAARTVLTWGKQFSSFPKSAAIGRCDTQRRRSPKKRPWDWRPRTFFLMHAMRQLRRKRLASAECAADPAYARAARGTPCEGLCTAGACLEMIHRAYA